MADKVKILGASAVKARLRRMAYQIYESNFGQERILIVGIDKRGGFLARQIADLLTEISPLRIDFTSALKVQGDQAIQLDEQAPELIKGCPVVVVDDVLYSGKTLFLAIAEVFAHAPKRIQTAVLIDRGHRNLPVTHDFVGMLLATSLKQHVSVEISSSDSSATAYLN